MAWLARQKRDKILEYQDQDNFFVPLESFILRTFFCKLFLFIFYSCKGKIS